MPLYCAAVNCINTSGVADKNVSFFRFFQETKKGKYLTLLSIMI